MAVPRRLQRSFKAKQIFRAVILKFLIDGSCSSHPQFESNKKTFICGHL